LEAKWGDTYPIVIKSWRKKMDDADPELDPGMSQLDIYF
jgi:hypothetical protein